SDNEESSVSAERPQAIYLKDYRPPAYQVERLELAFDLHETATRVTARLSLTAAERGAPLRLDGEDCKLLSLSLDGKPLPEDAYQLDDKSLTIAAPPERFELTVETEIDPSSNTRLEGLYLSGGTFCTQCEAEGFRRITYFPDRPDVLTRYRVTIRADKTRYPVLLSNGNL